MPTSPDAGADRAPATDVRPLPPRPSLEYERKEAKKLLRELRAGDATAAARMSAQWRGDDSRNRATLRLADAQLTIAREYGFTSWPRLVSYFETLERHERSPRSAQMTPDFYEREAASVISRHANRRLGVAGMLATFVPRFYGRSPNDVFASTVTIDEARLLVARQSMCTSWEMLIARARAMVERRSSEWQQAPTPHRLALDAIRAANVTELATLIETYPELLQPSESGGPDQALVHSALIAETRSDSADARALTDWLAARGADLTGALGRMLCGRPNMKTRDVELLLARGADPDWVAPNGYSALEHALVRYWNGEAIDLVAARGRPRRALWTAAALGDAADVDRYFKRDGTLTDAARKDRPDVSALFPSSAPMVPDAPDVDVMWEAFFVAALNGRFAVLDVLLDRGFPIDYASWSQPMLNLAVGNRLVPLVEYLVGRGASLDVRGYHPESTPRELAQSAFAGDPTNPATRRILELCDGGDPEALLRSHEAARANARPSLSESVRQQVVLSGVEAKLRGQSAVDPDNLFVALVVAAGSLVAEILKRAGADVERAMTLVSDRARAVQPSLGVDTPDVPVAPEAQSVVERALTDDSVRRTLTVTPAHMLLALVEVADSDLIRRFLEAGGATPARIREAASIYLA